MDVDNQAGEWAGRLSRVERLWSRRAPTWDHSELPGLESVVRAVLATAGSSTGLDIVDLGAGGGQLALAVAPGAATVTAVDISPAMLEILERRAAERGLTNVRARCVPLQHLDLPASSVDLIISNYALHHLHHREKAQLLVAAAGWLRPGGRIVIGDMMFGRGGDARDRQIIAGKAAAMIRRGPAGVWRLAKAGWRVLVSRRECPASIDAWTAMLSAAGFVDMSSTAVVAEAAVVAAARPTSPAAGAGTLRPATAPAPAPITRTSTTRHP